MRYQRAVEKLRILAEACESFRRYPLEEPFLLEAYVFGDALRGLDPLEFVQVVLVINLPPEEVTWESTPREVAFGRMRSVHASYWDYAWRRKNRGGGRYPENELWDAVRGYLDLLDAQDGQGGGVSVAAGGRELAAAGGAA